MRPDRRAFLRPPDAGGGGPMPPELKRALGEAGRALERALPAGAGQGGTRAGS